MTTTEIVTIAYRLVTGQRVTMPAMSASDLDRVLRLLKAARTI